MKNFLLICAFLLTGISAAFSQSRQQKIDSIFRVAEKSDDSTKFALHNQVAFFYVFNYPKKADSLLRLGINESRSKNLYASLAELTNTYGILKDVSNERDSSYFYFSEALRLSKEHNLLTIESRAVNNLGLCAWNQGKHTEALDLFFRSLELKREHPELLTQSSISYNNIGLIYQELEQYDKALMYHEKALKERVEKDFVPEQINSLVNIGICHRNMGDLEEAVATFNRGLDLVKKTDITYDWQALQNNLGNTYIDKNNQKAAKEAFLKALDVPSTSQSVPKADLIAYGGLTSVYNSLNQPRKAIEYANLGFETLAKSPEVRAYAGGLYSAAGESHFMINDIKKGRAYIDSVKVLQEEQFSEDNARALADSEIKYGTLEKERNLAETRANLAESELANKQKNNIIFSSLGLALILGLLGYLFYSQQKLKNRQLKKEGELKQALAKIETQNRLQEQRLRISRDLHDNIGSQLTFVTSSVDNLKFGLEQKDDVETSGKLARISEFTTQTIYELRDTIWAMNKSSVSFEDLQTRIANFMDKAQASDERINFYFDMKPEVDSTIEFSSVHGMNIYRIIQEAVNNSLKYSEAKNIQVTMGKSDDDGEYLLTIEDDGIGFNPDKNELGNGIRNMEKRAKDINGTIKLNSKDNEGTKVVLNFQKKNRAID